MIGKISSPDGATYVRSGVAWRLYHRALVPDLAPHESVEPDRQDARELLRLSGAQFMRWTTDFDCDQTGFWWVIKDSEASLESLPKKTRYEVRRASRRFELVPVSDLDLMNWGYGIYLSAMREYRNARSPVSEALFLTDVRSRARDPRYSFWGVRDHDTDRVVAYATTLVQANACTYSAFFIDAAFRPLNVGYLMVHGLNDYYLNQVGVTYVNDGARSLSHTSEIQDFLERRFGFRRAYCRLHLSYRPLLSVAVKAAYPFRRSLASRGGVALRTVVPLLAHEAIVRGDAAERVPTT